MTKNRTPTPVYLDPGMHPGLEVKGLMRFSTSYKHYTNVGACNLEIPGSNQGRLGYLSCTVWICHRGCAYTVIQTVQRHRVYSAVYGTVYNKEPLKSFEIRERHSPGFGLPTVAILP